MPFLGRTFTNSTVLLKGASQNAVVSSNFIGCKIKLSLNNNPLRTILQSELSKYI